MSGLETKRFSNEEVREYYSQLNGAYKRRWTIEGHESIHVGYFDDEHTDHAAAVENMKETVADAVDVGPGDRVLDAGCGLGETTTWLATNRGVEIVGINISEMQMRKGRQRAVEAGVSDRVTFQYDDFTEMETLEDDSFDVVWGLESICYAEDKRDFLEQARRVLKDDGRIVVADGYMTKRDLDADERQIMRRWLDGWKLPNLAHIDDFTADLDALGFENVDVHDARENVMPSSKSMYYFSFVGYPIVSVLHRLNLKTSTQVENVVACRNQYKALKRNLCTYAIVSAEIGNE